MIFKKTKLFQKIPLKYFQNFAKLYGIVNGLLFAEIITDYNNKMSKNIEEFGIKNLTQSFFDKLDEIIKMLIENEFYFYDVSQKNILVRRTSENEIEPVLIDYKFFNRKYPFQPIMNFKNGKINKIMRRYK